MPLESPLSRLHRELGANFTVFAGWRHPLDYGSIVEEHMAVRNSVGVFDLSHLGRLVVKGSGAKTLLERLVPRRLRGETGVIDGPTLFLNEEGGIIDDVLIYPLRGEWLVVTNAANRERVREWIGEWASRLSLDVKVEDVTMDTVIVAVQGPRSLETLAKVLGVEASTLDSISRMHFRLDVDTRLGRLWILSRSGWTGEDGFEVYTDPDTGEKLFRALVEAGARPCGLGARDSLRMEMGYPLIGVDIGEWVTPVEARYWIAFDQEKVASGECVGCKSVWERMRRGVERIRLGVRLGRGARLVPRQGDRILIGDVEVGRVTSGAYSPILGRGIGQAYVDARHALLGATVVLERGRRRVKAKLVDFPFITR